MRRMMLLGVWICSSVSLPAVAQQVDKGEFKPLFNGRDLAGWVPVNTAPSTWKVEDGMLICSGLPTGELRTDRMYQNFILELEWRHLRPRGNAGVFVWADDITAKGVPFHRSIEVQVLENAYGNTRSHTTHGDIFPIHGATMTPVNGRGGSRAFPTENRSRPAPEWNHYRIQCVDGEITLAVNGKVVTRGKDCSPRKGYICLESEGGLVHYRNVRIRELPQTEVGDQHVAIADRGYRSLYTGVDLSGWRTSPETPGHWQSRNWILHYDGKAAVADRTLATDAAFGDVGFIVDVRPGDASGVLQLGFGNEDGAWFVLQPEVFQKGWNRIEGTRRDGRITVRINGGAALPSQSVVATPGPLAIRSEGPVDLANLYVRELKSP